MRRVRLQDALFCVFFFFCVAVPFRTAGGQGYLAPDVDLGKLEVCQRPLDSVAARAEPVRGFLSGDIRYVRIFPLCFSGSTC